MYGKAPTASALPTLLKELEKLQSEGVLAGLLDLNKCHSGGDISGWGGGWPLKNADSQFFPSVVAAFAYGAHTAAITQLGYAAGNNPNLYQIRCPSC